jgi:HAE1 family hydrophobic/amphiphilic exporter-1
MLIITLILMLILSLRGAIITALAVPLAFLMAFIFLKIQGMTLNSMVLFSLVLSLGLMVDNAIVIIEGINEYVTHHKKNIYEAAILSVWNFKWAIIAGTMTTVAAFAPMLIVSGILGEYISILPKTITVTLLSSLFIAIVVIPTLASRFIKMDNGEDAGHRNKRRHRVINSWFDKLQNIYSHYMHKSLPSKKKRRKIIISAWIALIIAIIIPASGLMKIEMFPEVDLDYFLVNIELPVGSTLEVTKDITTNVEKIVQKIPELDNYVTNIGSGASLGMGNSAGSGTHLANITVNLVNKDNRERASYEIAESIRNQLGLVQGADVKVEELEAGPPSGAPIEMRIFGEEMEDITQTAIKVSAYLENDPEVINVKNTIENSTGEFTFKIDKQKANYYGLSIASVSQALRNAIYGTTATEVNLDGDDVDVVIKYDKDEFTNANDLKDILIFNNRGENVSLKQVADLSLEPSLLSIDHRNGKKIISVSADITSEANLQKVLARFEEYKKTIELPKNTTIEIGGETEDIQKSFTELFQSMGLAVLLIALILVLQFNSFKQPFIILFSVPLAFIGVITGLNLLGQPFSFTAFIGIVSLSGIVVNDSIVLIDRINKNIQNGMEFMEAIIEGGVARMQPIFLTSITTIAGVFPLIFASEMWVGLSFSIIFGLIFSTMLILVIIPMLYVSFCQKDHLKEKENINA